MKYMTLCLIRDGIFRYWVKAPDYKVSKGDIIETMVGGDFIQGIVEDCTTVVEPTKEQHTMLTIAIILHMLLNH